MTHIPKRAFVAYCPSTPTQPIANVDRVTLNGCSGQVAVESTGSVLLELLGLYDTNTTVDIKSRYKERFSDMSLAIISNSATASHVALELGCVYDTIQSINQIKQLKQDTVMIDFSDYQGDAWSFINDLYVVPVPDTIQCIISPAETVSLSESQSWYHTIVPRQSYTMKNGQFVQTIQSKLIYSYLHEGSSRRDDATSYNTLDIQTNGSNNTILAWHLLAEIGHKLGFVPKYGA